MARVDLHTVAPEPAVDASPKEPAWARSSPAAGSGGDGSGGGGGTCSEEARKDGTCPAAGLFPGGASATPQQKCPPVSLGGWNIHTFVNFDEFFTNLSPDLMRDRRIR